MYYYIIYKYFMQEKNVQIMNVIIKRKKFSVLNLTLTLVIEKKQTQLNPAYRKQKLLN